MKIANVKLTHAQIREIVISVEHRLWNFYGDSKKEKEILTRALESLKCVMKDMAGVA